MGKTINTAGLSDYIKQNRDELIQKIVLGGKTIKRMSIRKGIKTSEAIHFFEIDPQFQNGEGCGFTAQEGGMSLSDRVLTTGLIKVNMEICPDDLLRSYAEDLVKIGATEEELPFENYVVEAVIAKINAKMEKAVWQSDTDSEDETLNKFDGLLKLANAEEDTVKVEVAAGTSAYDAVEAVYLALPEEAIERGASIYLGADLYRKFLNDLVQKNLFHYSGPTNEQPSEYVFPGSNAVVVKANGLSGTNTMYASFDANMFYGCDTENDKEDVKIWFSDDDDLFKVKVKWNAGVQTAFPDMVVLGTFKAQATEPQATEPQVTGEDA